MSRLHSCSWSQSTSLFSDSQQLPLFPKDEVGQLSARRTARGGWAFRSVDSKHNPAVGVPGGPGSHPLLAGSHARDAIPRCPGQHRTHRETAWEARSNTGRRAPGSRNARRQAAAPGVTRKQSHATPSTRTKCAAITRTGADETSASRTEIFTARPSDG